MTEEDRKIILEWCGFQLWQPIEGGAYDILFPDGGLCLGRLLDLDLNFYFKYAVPKIGQIIGTPAQLILLKDWVVDFIFDVEDPADAFGEALLQLIKAKK